MISSHKIHTIMNPYQAQMEDEVRLEHYIKDILPLEKKARLSSHIPYSLDVETFNRAEAYFIQQYFDGWQDDYNEWKKENRRYFNED